MELPPYARQPWTEDDLLTIVAEQLNEDQHLEFKAIAALLNENERTELSRDVSSIANADGGTIIYGVTETKGIANGVEGAPAGAIDRDSLFSCP